LQRFNKKAWIPASAGTTGEAMIDRAGWNGRRRRLGGIRFGPAWQDLPASTCGRRLAGMAKLLKIIIELCVARRRARDSAYALIAH
jgi:hypothetical protein